MNTSLRTTLVATVGAAVLLLAGCTSGDAPQSQPDANPSATTSAPSPTPTATAIDTEDPNAMRVSSNDIVEGEEMPDWSTANYWDGQCTGDNQNPHLAWENLPAGTQSIAIVVLDRSGGNWVHWIHANIPADVTEAARGEWGTLPGVQGRNQATLEAGYFGPCPPSGVHRYEHAVWALDTFLELEEGFSLTDLRIAAQDHTLGTAAITPIRTGTN